MRRRSAALWLGTSCLAGLLFAAIARRGPLTLDRPETVLSHCPSAQQASIPFLRFLTEVRSRLSAGDRVVVLEPSNSMINFMIAIGQLPQQDVLHSSILQSSDRMSLPDWVAATGIEFVDGRFKPAGAVPGGVLYRVVR